MTKDEALKLALLVLWTSATPKCEEAITAVKAVLAQPDEDEIIIQYHEATIKRLENRIDELMAQPEQYSDIVSDGGLDPRNKPEPVAWWDAKLGVFDEKQFDQLQPLYTSPPKRQPLTDKKISDLWCEVSNTDYVTADTHVFARAIEAAHGIGDKT